MSKNKPIEYTQEQLIYLRDNKPQDLMNLIIEHQWLKNIYDGDWEQNHRLQIIRLFWARTQKSTPVKEKVDKTGQIKLI